jgi:hypothetical protein
LACKQKWTSPPLSDQILTTKTGFCLWAALLALSLDLASQVLTAVSPDPHLFFLEILTCRNPGKATSTLTLIVFGTALLISAGFHEVYTTRDALFPRAIFNNFNISMSTVSFFGTIFSDILLVIILIVSLLHNVAFNTGTFYLALYYQVRARVPSSERWDIFPYLRLSMYQSQIFAPELCSFLTPWVHPWRRYLLLGS